MVVTPLIPSAVLDPVGTVALPPSLAVPVGAGVAAGPGPEVQPKSKKSWHNGLVSPQAEPGGQYQSSSAETHCTDGLGLKPPAVQAGLDY